MSSYLVSVNHLEKLDEVVFDLAVNNIEIEAVFKVIGTAVVKTKKSKDEIKKLVTYKALSIEENKKLSAWK